MSTIINDRDVLLQATSPRDVNPTFDKTILITADTPMFRVTTGGTGSPSLINLTAKLLNIPGTVSWSVIGASSVTPTGNTATLAYANMTANTATVTAQITHQGTLFLTTYIITKVFDGTTGTNGSNGSDGQRGTVQIVVTGHSSWNSAAATAAIVTATGTSPINRDIATLTNSTSFAETRFYNAGSWLTLAAYIPGNMVVDGTLSCEALVADTMTGQIYRTAASGKRVIINDASSNRIDVYNSSSALIASLGGGSGNLTANAGSSIPGILASCASGATHAIWANASSGNALFCSGPSVIGTVTPSSNNSFTCGSASFAWSAMYSVTALNITSDEKRKKDVEPSDLGLAFIMRLQPVSYRLKVGYVTEELDNDFVGPWPLDVPAPLKQVEHPGTRRHYGLLAQQVKDSLHGQDAAFWCLEDKDNPDSAQSLRYGELVAPMIRAIQELQQEIEKLKARPKS